MKIMTMAGFSFRFSTAVSLVTLLTLVAVQGHGQQSTDAAHDEKPTAATTADTPKTNGDAPAGTDASVGQAAEKTSKEVAKDPVKEAPTEATKEAIKEATVESNALLKVAYFQKDRKDKFDTKIKAIFDQNKTCRSCDLIDRTPYNAKGEFDPDRLMNELEKIDKNFQIIFFDWNERFSEKNRSWTELIIQKQNQGILVMFSAGYPQPKEPALSLNKTIAGQIPEALIIGEMTDRERLLPMLFYGPEMLTAVKPPKEYMGQGFGPVFFVSRWISQWNRRKPNEWVSFLKVKKTKSKKLWLDLEDFFPR